MKIYDLNQDYGKWAKKQTAGFPWWWEPGGVASGEIVTQWAGSSPGLLKAVRLLSAGP